MRVASFVAAAMLAPAAALNIAITGSSQGIGLSAARQLLADGHNVFHACRSAERAAVAAEAAGGGTPLVCDLADLASVRSFAAELSTSATPLDVLCLNAGIAPSTRAELAKRTVDGSVAACCFTTAAAWLLAVCSVRHHIATPIAAASVIVPPGLRSASV